MSAQEKLEAEADKAERKAEKKAETEKKKKAVSISCAYLDIQLGSLLMLIFGILPWSFTLLRRQK